jgi:hypothetical protein
LGCGKTVVRRTCEEGSMGPCGRAPIPDLHDAVFVPTRIGQFPKYAPSVACEKNLIRRIFP